MEIDDSSSKLRKGPKQDKITNKEDILGLKSNFVDFS